MLAQALRTYWRMDTIALINTLAAEPSVAAAPSQPAAKQGSGQLDVVSQSPTADNAPVDTQETINEPAQDFSQTLQEKIDQQTGQEGQAVAETGQEGQVVVAETGQEGQAVVAETGQEGQAVVAETGQEGQAVAENPISNGFQVAGEAQPALDQGSLNVVGILTQGQGEQVDGLSEQPTALAATEDTAVSEILESSLNGAGATNSVAASSGQVATPAAQLEVITVAQNQVGAEANLLENSDMPAVTDNQQGSGANTDKAITANEMTAGKEPATVGSDSKLTDAIGTTDRQTAEVSEQPAAQPQIVSADGKAISAEDGLTASQEQQSDSQPKVASEPAIAPTTTNKTADSKSDTDQQVQQSPESSSDGSQEQANTSFDSSAFKDLGAEQAEISSSQTKSRTNATSNTSDADNSMKQTFSAVTAQDPVAEQSPVSTSGGEPTSGAPQSKEAADVSGQIQESIRSSLQQGDRQITVRLNPPELGQVYIKFQEQDGQLTGLMEVSKMQTRLDIERALPELVRNLQESGIQVKRVEVALTDQHESTDSGVFKDQAFATGREHWSGQQGSAGKDAQISDFNRDGANEWLTNADEYAEFAEPQGLITDKSINMLV